MSNAFAFFLLEQPFYYFVMPCKNWMQFSFFLNREWMEFNYIFLSVLLQEKIKERTRGKRGHFVSSKLGTCFTENLQFRVQARQ